MAEYVGHFARDENPLLTACGEPWQGWQAPEGYVAIPGHRVLPPHSEPRPHQDWIRQCRACVRVAHALV